MLHRFVVAIGAGCAAALLFAVSTQPSLLAMALAYLAPLPIMIATLGWGLDAGAIAGGISVAALALLSEPLSALLFAASVAGPAWALAAFAITPIARYFRTHKPDAPVHPSVGAVVTLAALFGIVGSAAVLTTSPPTLSMARRTNLRRANLLTRWCDLALRRSPPRRS